MFDRVRAPANLPGAYPLEQEYSLELPLGYAPEVFEVPPRIGVFLHGFHDDLLPEFAAYLDHINFSADLFISSDTDAKCGVARSLFAAWPKGKLEIRRMSNRGRDVAPKIVGFGAAHADYDLVLHLHTKRSDHESGLAGWRGYLLQALLGSAATVNGVLEAFRQRPTLGLVAPQQIDMLRPWIRWGDNHAQAAALAGRMGFALPVDAPLDFPAGSMFWARPAALRPLLDLNLDVADFPEEAGQTDGTLAHAIERLYFLVCEHAGYDWLKVAPAGLLNDQRGVTEIASALALRRFLARANLRLADLRDETRLLGEHARIVTLPTRPARPAHGAWRRALGEDLSATGCVAIISGVAAETERRHGIDAARLPRGVEARFIKPAAGAGWLNAALRAAFAGGADLALVLSQPGLLHPRALEAILQMSKAEAGAAILELFDIPQVSPKPVAPVSFELGQVGGPALAVPRAVFAAVGKLADTPDEAARGDSSTRAVTAGYTIRQCPRALFFPTADGLSRGEGALIPGLDVIIRLADVSDLPRLDRALFTVLGQDLALPLHVHLMLGRFSAEDLRRLRRLVEPLQNLRDGATITIHNWQLPGPLHVHVPLLNWALELAAGRYFMVVEVSDLLVAGAIHELLDRLAASGGPIVTARLAEQRVDWWGDTFVPAATAAGASENPATLFMLDRRRVKLGDLAFRAGEAEGEIGGFIKRVREGEPSDAGRNDRIIGVRELPI